MESAVNEMFLVVRRFRNNVVAVCCITDLSLLQLNQRVIVTHLSAVWLRV